MLNVNYSDLADVSKACTVYCYKKRLQDWLGVPQNYQLFTGNDRLIDANRFRLSSKSMIFKQDQQLRKQSTLNMGIGGGEIWEGGPIKFPLFKKLLRKFKINFCRIVSDVCKLFLCWEGCSPPKSPVFSTYDTEYLLECLPGKCDSCCSADNNRSKQENSLRFNESLSDNASFTNDSESFVRPWLPSIWIPFFGAFFSSSLCSGFFS